MSIIAAGNTTTTALVQTADTTGNLVFTTGGANTTALTISNAQAATFAGAVTITGTSTHTGNASFGNVTSSGTVTGAALIPSGSSVPTNGIYLPTANTVGFTIGATEKMRLDSSGRLSVGGATGASVINADGSVSGGASYSATSFGTVSQTNFFNFGNNTNLSTTEGSYLSFRRNYDNVEVVYWDGAGNAFKRSGAGSWLATSDERIKTNIQDSVGGLENIIALKPKTFDYKKPDAHGKASDKGFIAQDFQAVYPDSVKETSIDLHPLEKEYFNDGEKMKNIGFNAEFFADLVSAIQELKAELDQTKAEVAALKAGA